MTVKSTTASLKKKAWKILSEFIRRSYSDRNGFCRCYTCEKVLDWKTDAQAGHAIGGRRGAVLLDPEIIRPQCVGCNVFGRGNYPIFTTKLIKEKGMDWWEGKLEQSRQVRKWTRSELEEFIETYKEKLNALET